MREKTETSCVVVRAPLTVTLNVVPSILLALTSGYSSIVVIGGRRAAIAKLHAEEFGADRDERLGYPIAAMIRLLQESGRA